MDSIIEQSKGKVEIGYLTNGKVNLEDRKKTQKAADQACRILAKAFKSNFSWWGLGYGSCMVQFNYQTNELAWNNIDEGRKALFFCKLANHRQRMGL